MKIFSTSKTTLAAGSVAALLAAPAAADCGLVTVADMNWASAEFAAHVDRIVLEEAFGCAVSIVPGDTVPTVTSMTEKGEPDIAPETWVNSAGEALARAVDEGRLVYAGKILVEGALEGWFIPQYIKDAHPEIETIDDALERPDLFVHPEYSDLGAVYGCPSGWACEYVNENLFRAYEGEERSFELVDPGSSAGLDGAIASAYERGEPWLGYYWAPTAILGKYPMYRLSFGVAHDAEHWAACTSVPECPDPKRNAWVEPDVYTVVTASFAEAAPEAVAWLEKRGWSNAIAGDVLAYMSDNQLLGEDGALYFLEKYEDLWTSWLSEEQAAKVKSAL